MKIIVVAHKESSVELATCLIGSPCEVGQYTGQSDGVPGTFVGHWGKFFIGNFPKWDGEFDASNTFSYITFDTENLKVDPWMAAKYEIPIKASIPYRDVDNEVRMVRCILDYRIPKTGNKWRTMCGDEVIIDENFTIDPEAALDFEGVTRL